MFLILMFQIKLEIQHKGHRIQMCKDKSKVENLFVQDFIRFQDLGF